MLRYAASELVFRRGRSLVTAVSIALAVLAAVVLTSLAASYAQALRVPIETVGADVIVQQQGDIPSKLEGLVFPHPNALIPADVVQHIKTFPGVIGLTRAVYIWDLEPDRYESVLGIDDNEVGLQGLDQRLIDGKPLRTANRAVLLDSDYATKNKVKVGDTIKVGADEFPVAGIVDAARGGKLVRADVYMPLPIAQALATAAPQVRALYPFGADDANLVLVKLNREQLQSVVEDITSLVGKKGVVSSELSMRQALSGVLFLSQSMGMIIAAIIVALAFVVVLALGHISVTVDLPWDLSSTPHFIPAATINRTQTITAPLSIPWSTAGIATAGSLAISLLAVLAVLALPRPQPWSLLRAE